MKKIKWLLVIVPFFIQSYGVVTTEHQTAKKWVSLFNGKDINGWTPRITGYKPGENFGNTFRVADGILSTRYDQYDSFSNKFGALFYNKKFSNYRLKVEYRFTGKLTRGAPSWGLRDGGIQYHCQSPESMGLNQPFPVCLEYNLLGERPTGEICTSGTWVEIDGKKNTLFCTPPETKKTFPGDQWVTAEIDVHDGTITHYVDGEQIIQFKNPHYDATHAIAKTFIINGNDVLNDGYISLQSNSHPMDFRKIEIMEY